MSKDTAYRDARDAMIEKLREEIATLKTARSPVVALVKSPPQSAVRFSPLRPFKQMLPGGRALKSILRSVLADDDGDDTALDIVCFAVAVLSLGTALIPRWFIRQMFHLDEVETARRFREWYRS